MNTPSNVSSSPGLTWDDLPLWMRQVRRVDWALVYALLLGLLSAWPFLLRGGLPHGTALELYVYRAAEMADVMAEGDLMPRWAPHLMYGYGLPLFQFNAPLSSYLPALLQLATETDAVLGVRLTLVIAAVGGVAGMFAFVRRRWGVWAALIAAAAYTFSPPLLYLLPYVYGDLPLLLALQWLPGLLWAVDRVLVSGGGRDLWLVALLAALLILTDEFCALWMLSLAVGWAAWHWLFWRAAGQKGARPNARLAAAGLLMGLGLAAFFWLPAVLEQGDIHWLAVPPLPGQPLTLGELLAAPASADVAAFVPLAPRSLGLALWGLGLVGLAGLAMHWRHGHFSDRLVLYFALAGAGLAAWLLAGAAGWLLPQQVLAVLVFPLAVLAGQAARWPEQWRAGWPRHVGLALLLILPLLAALPALSPPLWAEDFGDSDVNARLRLELKEYGLATVPPGESIPLPVAMAAPPAPARRLVESYFAGRGDRVNRAAIVGNEVDVLEHYARAERLLVHARTSLTLPLYLSAFAAWEVRVDGRPVPRVSDVSGLLEVPLAAGEHEVAVSLSLTAARIAGWVVSGLALLLTGLTASRVSQRRPPVEALPLFTRPQVRTAGLALAGFMLLLPLLGQPGLFWRRSAGGIIEDASSVLRYYSQAGLDLLGYDAGSTVLRPGESLALRLFWRAVRSPSEDLQVSITLVSQADGQRVAQSQKRHVGNYPTTLWPLDRYVHDEHQLLIPPDTPPGVYQLTVELWQCQAALGACSPEQRLLLFDERAQPVGQSLVLPLLVTVP